MGNTRGGSELSKYITVDGDFLSLERYLGGMYHYDNLQICDTGSKMRYIRGEKIGIAWTQFSSRIKSPINRNHKNYIIKDVSVQSGTASLRRLPARDKGAITL